MFSLNRYILSLLSSSVLYGPMSSQNASISKVSFARYELHLSQTSFVDFHILYEFIAAINAEVNIPRMLKIFFHIAQSKIDKSPLNIALKKAKIITISSSLL